MEDSPRRASAAGAGSTEGCDAAVHDRSDGTEDDVAMGQTSGTDDDGRVYLRSLFYFILKSQEKS
jgi:hypothetical protein